MATAEEYAGWIVQNQDKRGTPEFDTVAQAYKLSKGQTDKPTMQKLPTMADSLGEAINADVSPTGAKIVSGIGSAVDNAAMRLKQLVTGGLNPQDTANVQANRDLSSVSGAPGMAGQVAGGMMMTGAPAASLYRGGAALAGRILPGMVAPTVAAGATGATVAGLTNPVLPGESEGANLAAGAAGGALGDAGARVLGRVAHPIMQSGPVRALLGEGVVPTPGQAAGANSFVGRLEQRLQSIPLIGDLITHGRNRAVAEFNEAAINRAVPAGTPRVNGIGRGAIGQVDSILHNGYNDVLDRIGSVQLTPQATQRMAAVVADPDLALPQHLQQRLNEIIQQQITNRAANGVLPADLAKRADANLGMLARGYSNSQDADQRMLARGIRDVQATWRNSIRDAATPEQQTELDALNRAFANFVRVERAAGSQGAREGVFSPAQLQSAVRATDSSARRGRFARGQALMQDLTEPAVATLPQTVPNSGTIDRGLMAMLAGGALGAGNEYLGGPGYLTGLALAPLAYSRAGSRYALGNLIPGQQAAGALARQGAPYATNAGGILASLLKQQESK